MAQMLITSGGGGELNFTGLMISGMSLYADRTRSICNCVRFCHSHGIVNFCIIINPVVFFFACTGRIVEVRMTVLCPLSRAYGFHQCV